MDINIGKGRLQGEGRSRLEFSPVLVLCLNLAEYTPSISEKKQASLETVGLSRQCSVLLRSGLDS
jgi:hypothetical protein